MEILKINETMIKEKPGQWKREYRIFKEQKERNKNESNSRNALVSVKLMYFEIRESKTC